MDCFAVNLNSEPESMLWDFYDVVKSLMKVRCD